VLIGAIAGALVVFAVLTLDRVRLDDPVGAIAVHLVCGVWGTLAVGLFGAKAGLGQLGVQAIGVAAVGALAFVGAFVLFAALRATVGIRVSPAEELAGLDVEEHGYLAYPYFQEADALGGIETPAIGASVIVQGLPGGNS